MGSSPSGSDRRRSEAQEGATVRLPQLPARIGKLVGESRNGRKDGPGASTPLERQDNARAVCASGEFVDDGRSGLDDEGDATGVANLELGYRDREKRRQAMFYRREIQDLPSKLLINMVGTTGFEPATSSVSIRTSLVSY